MLRCGIVSRFGRSMPSFRIETKCSVQASVCTVLCVEQKHKQVNACLIACCTRLGLCVSRAVLKIQFCLSTLSHMRRTQPTSTQNWFNFGGSLVPLFRMGWENPAHLEKQQTSSVGSCNGIVCRDTLRITDAKNNNSQKKSEFCWRKVF